MAHIYTIGETVYDLIFKEGRPVSGTAGGAMLNASVTLGRLDLPISFISEIGTDPMGDLIISFLLQNQISTDFICRDANTKTALSLAFLDERNDATYDFYKQVSEKEFRIPLPEFQPSDYFMFGSLFALTPRYLPFLKRLTGSAQGAGSIVYYDPNFRTTHLNQLADLKPVILDSIQSSDLIRGSDEDFYHIFGAEDPDTAWEHVRDMTEVLIYTASKKGVYLFTQSVKKMYPVERIKPVSTIGAGDNFNAGIVYSLYTHKVRKDHLPDMKSEDWDPVIKNGISFGTLACMTMENYLTKQQVTNRTADQ